MIQNHPRNAGRPPAVRKKMKKRLPHPDYSFTLYFVIDPVPTIGATVPDRFARDGDPLTVRIFLTEA
jgi:hypothetical protein